MAETLGSLVDKLTIKSIREYHLAEMITAKNAKFSRSELEEKLRLLRRQKLALESEIDAFLKGALKGTVVRLRDEKLKLYNAPETMGRISGTEGLGRAMDGLARKNLELWHLEDEARRRDVSLAHIGKVKQKIDYVNQQRNDFIDKIDELFEDRIKKLCRNTREKTV